jgi:hypothetical protein
MEGTQDDNAEGFSQIAHVVSRATRKYMRKLFALNTRQVARYRDVTTLDSMLLYLHRTTADRALGKKLR